MGSVAHGTDFCGCFGQNRGMDVAREELIESAEVYDNGVIVTFGDGKFAFYPAALLRAVFGQAEELHGTAEDAVADATWKRRS